MLLITHPDNVKKIQSLCKTDESYASYAHLFHSAYRLIECEFMPATRPSGTYRINGKGRFELEDVCVKTRFCTYGPEDIDWLLYAGIAEEIQEMNILCMHESQWNFFSKPVEPMWIGGAGLSGRELAASISMIKNVLF